MRVDSHDFKPVLFGDRLDLRNVLVPDSERRRGAAHVCALRSARTQPRIDSHADLSAAGDFPESFKLVERARVVEHARFHNLFQVFRQLLRRQRNVGGVYSRADCAFDFECAGRVDMQPELVEEFENRRVRCSLHRVPYGKPERVGEGEGGLRLFYERRFVVDVARGFEFCGYFLLQFCRREILGCSIFI